MKSTGTIGIGNMGSGLAENLIKHGLSVYGSDPKPERMDAFTQMRGIAAATPSQVCKNMQAAFVMVMTGDQAKSVILGEDGLAAHLSKGDAAILTATIKPKEARETGSAMEGTGVHLIDAPVSGGYPGAQNGTLSMMAAAPDSVFEAATLAAKAGVYGQVLLDVFSTPSAGCGVVNNALEKIIDRQFEGTGGHINAIHKDLPISMSLGEDLGVPLHTAGAAMQIFHAGKAKYPEGDNWIYTRVMEELVGAELRREAKSKRLASFAVVSVTMTHRPPIGRL